MIEKPGFPVEPDSFEQFVYDNSLGKPIELSEAPTSSQGQLQEKTIGFFGTNLYITLGGVTYRITMAAV